VRVAVLLAATDEAAVTAYSVVAVTIAVCRSSARRRWVLQLLLAAETITVMGVPRDDDRCTVAAARGGAVWRRRRAVAARVMSRRASACGRALSCVAGDVASVGVALEECGASTDSVAGAAAVCGVRRYNDGTS
jgi:hypothetical protein